jgi:hypothetical protein
MRIRHPLVAAALGAQAQDRLASHPGPSHDVEGDHHVITVPPGGLQRHEQRLLAQVLLIRRTSEEACLEAVHLPGVLLHASEESGSRLVVSGRGGAPKRILLGERKPATQRGHIKCDRGSHRAISGGAIDEDRASSPPS